MAFIKNSVEMEVTIENKADVERWVECDIIIPEAISLSSDKPLSRGRIRMGLLKPTEKMNKRVKIYGGKSSYPELYSVKLVAYGFEGEGNITVKAEKKSELRCEKFAIEE